jgi:predicted amidohydrolase
MVSPDTIGCWLGVASLVLLATGMPATAGDAASPDIGKKQGKLGSRLVGVSCICQPDGRSIAETEKFIDAAAQDKPDLILLTEGCMQNSPRSATRKEKEDKADPLPEPGPITQFLSRKAAQYHCYIMASYWRKAPKGAGRYNSAVLFDRQGKVAGWYDKAFPTIGEMEDGILPGKGAVVFDTDFGRIGAMICYDFNFMELLAEYKKAGAELICFLSNYRAGKLIPAAALRNQCFFASAIPGENGVIVDPLGRALAESSMYGRIIFARINLDSRVVHIDFNIDRVRKLKEKYGPLVKIEVASPEAVYYLTSLHPDVSVGDMIKEFEVETLDAYLDRARAMRKEYLQKAE